MIPFSWLNTIPWYGEPRSVSPAGKPLGHVRSWVSFFCECVSSFFFRSAIAKLPGVTLYLT
jgi:hypothetical protein